MYTLNLRYRLTKDEEALVVEDILEANPFFGDRELFKYLLGYYKKTEDEKKFKKNRLEAVKNSFGITAKNQKDDYIISKKVKVKPIKF